MKHKHAELIKAWADGATIQGKVAGDINWHDMVNPAWDGIEIEYRIKPEEKKPVVRWQWAVKSKSNHWYAPVMFMTEDEVSKQYIQYKRLDWSATTFEE